MKKFLLVVLICLIGQITNAKAPIYTISNNPFDRMVDMGCIENECTFMLPKLRLYPKYNVTNVYVHFNKKNKTFYLDQDIFYIWVGNSKPMCAAYEMGLNGQKFFIVARCKILSENTPTIDFEPHYSNYNSLNTMWKYKAHSIIPMQYLNFLEKNLSSCEIYKTQTRYLKKNYYQFMCSNDVTFSLQTGLFYNATQLKDMVYLKKYFLDNGYKFVEKKLF